LTLAVLDKTVAELQSAQTAWNGDSVVPLEKDGSPRDANLVAEILADNLGMKKYPHRVYDSKNGWQQVTLTPKEFADSEYTHGIEHRTYTPTTAPEPWNHYTTIMAERDTHVSVDPLDPTRGPAKLYEVQTVAPLQWLTVDRKEE
jgi:hypothetical protein